MSSDEVLSIRTRVMVGGVHRPHVSWSAEGGIDGSLPAQVAGGNRVVERSGQVEFAHSNVVQESPESPWGRAGGWPPRRGDRVEVWDDIETVSGPYSYRQFTGRIDEVWGEDSVTASIIDDWDDLARPVQVLPMMRSMPGVRTSGLTAAPAYATALRPFAPVYKALEQAGHGLLPTTGGTVMFHAAFQGGVVPDAGGVISPPANRYPTGEELEYVEDMVLAEAWGGSVGGGTTSLGIMLRASKMVFTRHSSYPSVILTSGDARVEVQARANGVVRLLSDNVEVASVQVDYGPEDMLGVALLWTTAGVYVYSVGSGAEVSTASPGTPVSLPDASCRVRWCAAVRVTRGEGRSSWLARMRAVKAVPFVHRRAAWGGGSDASRFLDGVPAKQVLSQYAEHQMVSIWRDEHGVLQMWGADRLAEKPVVRTYTTTGEVASLPWRESWESVRSGVVVSYREAARTRTDYWGVALWQDATSKQLREGDVDSVFVEPGADEDWIEPDFTVDEARVNVGNGFNYGNGSWWGAIYSREDVAEGAWANAYVTFTSRQVGPMKMLVEHAVSGAPADVRVQLQAPPPEAPTAIWRQWRDTPLPIIRGRGKVTWADARTSEGPAGPSWAPVLDFDMGWWGIAQDAIAVRDWLAPQVTTPVVSLDRLTLRYDPALQLGDMIRIDAGETHGVSIVGLVTGMARSHDTGGHSMQVTVQVRSHEATGEATYRDLEDAWATYSALEAGNSTYAELESISPGGAV